MSDRHVGSGQTYTTIQAAVNDAVAGDNIIVHSGTYTEQVSLGISGSAGSRITIRNNTGDSPLLTNTTAPVLNINGKSYWTIDGINITYNGTDVNAKGIQNLHGASIDGITVKNLTVIMADATGSDGCGIFLQDTDGAVITNNTVEVSSTRAGTGISGVDFGYASNLEFSGNTVFGSGSETDNKMKDGCGFSGTNINIENNIIHSGCSFDFHPDGIVISGLGSRTGANTANVKVIRNTLWNWTQGIYFDAIFNPIEGTNLVDNNILYETSAYRYGGSANKMSAIVMDGESLSPPPFYTVSAKIYNNTLDPKQLWLYIARTASGSSIDVKNNVYLTPGFAGVRVETIFGVTIDYDYFSGGDSTPIHWDGTNYTLANFKSTINQELNSASGTAGLNGDYTETSSSDTRDRGVNLFSTFTNDRFGDTRPSAGAWDMGMDQFLSSPTPSAIPLPPGGVSFG